MAGKTGRRKNSIQITSYRLTGKKIRFLLFCVSVSLWQIISCEATSPLCLRVFVAKKSCEATSIMVSAFVLDRTKCDSTKTKADKLTITI